MAGAGAGAQSYNSAGAGAGAGDEKPEFAQHYSKQNELIVLCENSDCVLSSFVLWLSTD